MAANMRRLAFIAALAVGSLPVPAQEGSHLIGSLDFYVLQQDLGGKVIDTSESRINLHLSTAEYAADLRTGVPCSASVELRAETRTLRLLVQDRVSSRIGTLIVPVSEIK